MKDIQKIKEFFSKPLNEGNKEYFKPLIRKDKSNPNFLFVDITYPEGSDVLSVGGSKTMGGQDREEGAAKALTMGNNIAKKLEAKYNIEDIEVKDLKNGKVEVFAVSDDFTKMASPSLNEDEEEETAVDMAKKQLDALGVKYEMSGNKFKPFKTIYKPNNKSNSFYKEFNRIVYEFNLESAVEQAIKENNSIDYTKLISLIKSANNPRNLPIYYNSDNGVVNIGGVGYDKGELVKMFNSQPGQSLDIKNLFYKANQNPEETKNAIESMDPSIKVEIGYGYGNEPFVKYIKSINEANGFTSGKQFINIKLKNYPKAVTKINQLIDMIGEPNFTMEMAEWIWDFFNNASFERPVNEAKEEDVVDTITMDIPLFIRMLEYSREDASADVDLHDVTEKAISLNKEKDILSMDDYNEIVGAAEEIEEGFYGKGDKRRGLQNASKLSSAEYQMAKKLKSFNASDWKWNTDEDLYVKVNEVELTEANVPSNIKEFAKRKGVSSLVNKVAGWAERVGKRIAGGTAVGKNYSTLVLDLDYQQNGEIRINTDDETVTLYDEPVNSFPEFKRVYLDDQDDTIEEGVGNDLDEPYFIEVSVRDARKAMDMFDDMYRRSNIKTYGSNVYAASTPEDIYDLYYDLNNQGIEILDYNVDGDLDEATDYMKRRQAQNDYAVSKKDKPAKSTNPNASGDTDYMKLRKKELAEAIIAKLKK